MPGLRTACLLSCTGMAFMGHVGAADNSDPDRRPNILFILADNWGYPHASINGDPLATTPGFDRLAREGALFTHVFNASPSCAPTRASILTGRPPHQLGEAGNLWGGFSASHVTCTRMLRDAGYAVGYAGKAWAPGNYTLYGQSENPVGRRHDSFDAFLKQQDAATPFFFWLGNTDTATRPGFTGWQYDADTDAVDATRITVPPELPDAPAIRRDIQAYYGGVRKLDRTITAAVAALEARGLLDRTVIICTGDNGWQMPRGLGNCYDAGSRVPMAIRWPGVVRPGTRIDALVSHTDLTATFLEIAGLRPTADMTSRSFTGLLAGRPDDDRDAVFIERERHANVRVGNLGYPMRAVRERRHLYIRNLRPDRWPGGDPRLHFDVGPFGDVDACRAKDFLLQQRTATPDAFDHIFGKRPAEELYDVERDPRQRDNLASHPDQAEVLNRLRARLDQWMRSTRDPRLDPACDIWDHYPYYAPGVLDRNTAGEPMH